MRGESGRDGLPEETPGRVDIALAIPLREGKLLVSRRPPGADLEGYWEFPGGKIEAGEDPIHGARRELEEETGLRAGLLEPLGLFVHDYREVPLRFHAFLARGVEGEAKQAPPREWIWKSYPELLELEMPPANRQMLRALKWRLG